MSQAGEGGAGPGTGTPPLPGPERGPDPAGPDRVWTRAFLLTAAFFLLIQVWSLTGSTMRGDERFYFFSAHNMAESGDWLTPKDRYGYPRVHKPPLYTWLSALVFELTGPSLAAQRSISILAILGTAALVQALGLLLFGSVRASALAGIMLLGFNEVFLTSHQARTDTLLLFLVTASAYSFVRVLTGTGRGTGWSLLGYLLAGLAFLTKGPYGLLHALPPVLVAALVRPPSRARLKTLLHPLGWLIFITVSGSWYAALVAAHSPAIWDKVMGDLAVHAPEGNVLFSFVRNLGRYLPAMATTALPWWPLLVLGLVARRRGPEPARTERDRLARAFLWAWAGTVVLTVFINPSWFRRYVLALYPALALLGSSWLSRVEEAPAWVRTRALPGLLAFLGLVLVAATVPLLWGFFSYGGRISDPLALLLPVSLAALGLAALLWLFWKRSSLPGWAACLACLAILVNGAYDRNFNVPDNRGAVAALSARALAPLDPARVRVVCLELHPSDCPPVLDRGGKPPLTRYSLDDPSGIVRDRLAFPDQSRETLVLTMAHLWQGLDPKIKERLEPVQSLTYGSLVRGRGAFLRLDERECLLLRLKPGS